MVRPDLEKYSFMSLNSRLPASLSERDCDSKFLFCDEAVEYVTGANAVDQETTVDVTTEQIDPWTFHVSVVKIDPGSDEAITLWPVAGKTDPRLAVLVGIWTSFLRDSDPNLSVSVWLKSSTWLASRADEFGFDLGLGLLGDFSRLDQLPLLSDEEIPESERSRVGDWLRRSARGDRGVIFDPPNVVASSVAAVTMRSGLLEIVVAAPAICCWLLGSGVLEREDDFLLGDAGWDETAEAFSGIRR